MPCRSGCLCFFVISFLLVSPTKNIGIRKSVYQFQKSKQNTKPNIVIILIDDMGYNDLSFHVSTQILTPNMDSLAYNGIILNRHYVPNLCTLWRSALLTGKYPIHTGMISRLDESVSKTMEALAKKGILDNTIVLSYSDNGAPTVGLYVNTDSNYPFRGQKESPWECGIRSTSFLWCSLLKQRHFLTHQVMHAIDWFPNLAVAVGIKLLNNLHLDGINLRPSLNDKHLPRRVLHVLDDIFGYTSYIRDNYKYVSARVHSSQMETLSQQVNEFRRQATLSAQIATADTRSDPKRFNGNWQWWYSSAGPKSTFRLFQINSSDLPIKILRCKSFI
uniref:Sulfatase N-terminal domain-containing protein n=1 Tax=Glossina austeni TaxID=7395 RepID=A0A1A9UM25_GLOAU